LLPGLSGNRITKEVLYTAKLTAGDVFKGVMPRLDRIKPGREEQQALLFSVAGALNFLSQYSKKKKGTAAGRTLRWLISHLCSLTGQTTTYFEQLIH
jgi:hypothetical protein